MRIPPVHIVKNGVFDRDLVELFCANVRAPRERKEDLVAQVETLKRGIARLEEAEQRLGLQSMLAAAHALREAAGHAARRLVSSLEPGVRTFADELDGGLKIRVRIEPKVDRLVVDFDGTDPQTDLPLNANYAVTLSAVTYALALLLPKETPLNEGVREVLDVRAPEGTLVNALYPAPVAGGNVETSQRIVDVVLGALGCVAASQGTMNNLTVGGDGFTYYETMAGGAGAGPNGPGASALQTHMTNTRNTPIEALENSTPMLVRKLQVARGTGGAGRHAGGDGMLKEIEFLAPCVVHMLSDRRDRGPYGLAGGRPGEPGKNSFGGQPAPGRFRKEVAPGDRLSVRTPGGGGWGEPV